jgi:hypothetical protein
MRYPLFAIAILGIPLAIPVFVLIRVIRSFTKKRGEGFEDLGLTILVAVFAGFAEIGAIIGGIIGACVGVPIFGSAMLGFMVVVIGEIIFYAIKK